MDSRQIQPGGVDNGRRSGADSGQIKAEIDHTRGRIDDTLGALADKLHPKHLLDEAVDYLRSPGQVSGTAGKVGRTVWHQIQEHPMPSLLIAAGIAWMLSEQKGSTSRRRTSRAWESAAEQEDGGEWGDEATASEAFRPEQSAKSKMAENTAALGQSVKAKTAAVADSVRDKTGQIAESIKEKTQNVKEKGVEQAMRFKEATSNMTTQTRERAGAMVERAEAAFSDATDRYPLAVGVGFLAIGVLAGLALPHSRVEDETLGEQADELKEKVRDQGRQAVETAKRAATAVANTAAEEAQKQGLTPENLGEKIQHVATAAADAARREGGLKT